MATPAGKVPIIESAGQGVRFLRENWRFGLGIAAIGAAAQTAAFVAFGLTPAWMLTAGLVSAFVHATFLNAALNGPQGAAARISIDGARVLAAMAMVGLFIAIVLFMCLYVAMSILIAPYAQEVQAAGQDSEQLMAIMNRAAAAQPQILMWGVIVAGVLILLLTSRLYLAAAASVDQNRIVVFDSWRWTKGNLLRIAGARVLLLGPALILIGALQSIIASAFGAPADDATALAASAHAIPVIAFYFVAAVTQILIVGMLEAGLAAYLYRGLRPAPPVSA